MSFEFTMKCQPDGTPSKPYWPAQQKPPTAAPAVKKVKVGEKVKGGEIVKVGEKVKGGAAVGGGKAKKAPRSVIPLKYLQVWKPGQGCPCMTCPGAKCHYPGKVPFQAHWLTYHRAKVQVYLCPAPACSKDFRRKEGLKGHYSKSHSTFGELDMARVATRQEPNDKYKRPQLPPSGGKIQPVASPSLEPEPEPELDDEYWDDAMSFEEEEEENITSELPATAVKYMKQVKELHVQKEVGRLTLEKHKALKSPESLAGWLTQLHEPAYLLAERELLAVLQKEKMKAAHERMELITQFYTTRQKEALGEYNDMYGLLLTQVYRHFAGNAEIKMKLIVGEIERESEENVEEKTSFLHNLTLGHIMNTA